MDLTRSYGAAAMAAAGLEQTLVLLIALERSSGKSDEEFSSAHRSLEKKPLGRLISIALNEVEFSEGSERQFEHVLKYRNWLVHGFSQDIAKYFSQSSGEAILIHNLKEIEEFFINVSEILRVGNEERIRERGIDIDVVGKFAKFLIYGE